MCLEAFKHPLSQYVGQNAAADVDMSFALSAFPAHVCIIAALKPSALNRYFGFKSHRFNFKLSSFSFSLTILEQVFFTMAYVNHWSPKSQIKS